MKKLPKVFEIATDTGRGFDLTYGGQVAIFDAKVPKGAYGVQIKCVDGETIRFALSNEGAYALFIALGQELEAGRLAKGEAIMKKRLGK